MTAHEDVQRSSAFRGAFAKQTGHVRPQRVIVITSACQMNPGQTGLGMP